MVLSHDVFSLHYFTELSIYTAISKYFYIPSRYPGIFREGGCTSQNLVIGGAWLEEVPAMEVCVPESHWRSKRLWGSLGEGRLQCCESPQVLEWQDDDDDDLSHLCYCSGTVPQQSFFAAPFEEPKTSFAHELQEWHDRHFTETTHNQFDQIAISLTYSHWPCLCWSADNWNSSENQKMGQLEARDKDGCSPRRRG